MLVCLVLASASLAQVAVPPEVVAPTFSSELLDPEGFSRFHLVTRATFSDGDRVFSSASAWSAEARAQLRLRKGLAIGATIPLGVFRSGPIREGFIGNLSLGVSGGLGFPLAEGTELRVGGAFDLYLPTAPAPESLDLARAQGTVAAIRAYEPQLYIPSLFSFRPRLYADLMLAGFQAAVELGLTPGWTVKAPSKNLILFSAAGRLSYQIGRYVEPYVELTGSTQISGDGEVAPPFLLTPGVRFHIADTFDPAISLSFNFVTPSAVIFCIDLASAFRSSKPPRDEDREDHDDFLEGSDV